jgi:hypothetical protein
MEADSPEIAPLLYAYCYARFLLRRAAEVAKSPGCSAEDAHTVRRARARFLSAKRAYFDAVDPPSSAPLCEEAQGLCTPHAPRAEHSLAHVVNPVGRIEPPL